MRRVLLPAALALALGVAPSAFAAEQRIAAGVTAGGVDLSGLLVEEAAAKLERELAPRVLRVTAVVAAGRRFALDAQRAKLTFDALTTAKRAYYAGRDGTPPLAVPPAVSHSRVAVRDFTAGVTRSTLRPARNAKLTIGLRRMHIRPTRHGLRVDSRALAGQISAALDDPAAAASRFFRPRRERVRPKVTVAGLRRQYRTVVTVDRTNFRLRLFKSLRLRKTYGIAVGLAGLDTPRGRFRITSRQVNPAWHVPNRAWAGSLAGTVVPGGAANNPLKARWLGIVNGVGIHGTAEEWSIGSRASHGCIRMRVRDVVDLYPRVPLGTAVLIR